MIGKSSVWSGRWKMSVLGVVALLSPAIAAQARPFTSAKGYSATPPAGWRVNSKGMMGSDVIFAAPPSRGFVSSFNVVVTQAPGETLEGGRRQINSMLPKAFAGYKRVAQGYTTLGGLRALSTTSSYLIGTPSRRLRMKQIVVLRRNRAFTFTVAALDTDFARYNAAFNKILQSVRFR